MSPVMKLCAHRGCPMLAPLGSRHCAGHTVEYAKRDQRRRSAKWQQRLWESPRWRRTRRAVLERDGFTCQNCGAQPTKPRGLHAHHLDPVSEAPESWFDLDRIITLWAPCHGRADGGRA